MRFPDLLVLVNKLAERQRLLEVDIEALRRSLVKVFPESAQYFTVLNGQSNVEGQADGDPTLF